MRVTAYRTVAGTVRARVEDRRSVFECRLHRVASPDQVHEVLAQARVEHGEARHHCSAFVLGPDGAVRGSSDDGEPAGTAGAPMLDVLAGSGLTDVVAVVSRWFGGTLLGRGGLIRAYSGAVHSAVQRARPQPRTLLTLAELSVGHEVAGRVEHELRSRGVLIRHTSYGAAVTLSLAVRPAQATSLPDLVAALTAGESELIDRGQQWVDG